MIDIGGPNHDDLDVERDRVRPQRRRGKGPERLAQGLDPDLPAAERALESFIGERAGEHVTRLENEEAAVRAVEGAGLDHREVRDERAELGPVLRLAHQIVVGGVALDDHRRPAGVPVVHQQVDLVPGERIPAEERELLARLLGALLVSGAA